MGTLIYTFWGIFYTKSVAGGSVAEYLITKLSVTNLAKWFIINVNPFSGHLWYLSAILTCYVVLWVYVRFFDKKEVDYKPLYIVSICLILFQLALGVNAVASKTDIHYLIYRNALFFGLPMFCMGMFIKQYYTQIISSFNLNAIKEFAIMIFGAALSLLQWFGFGKIEMPVGMIITVIMLMLFLASHPLFTKQRFIITIVSRFGNISLIELMYNGVTYEKNYRKIPNNYDNYRCNRYLVVSDFRALVGGALSGNGIVAACVDGCVDDARYARQKSSSHRACAHRLENRFALLCQRHFPCNPLPFVV